MSDFLNQQIAVLEAFPSFAGRSKDLARVQDVIRASSDWDLFRINPLLFAKRHQFEEWFAVDFFVHGTKLGLFDFQWNIICSGCGGVEYSLAGIQDVRQRSYHCTICNVEVPADVDDQLEVAFNVNLKVRRLAIDPFESFDSYRRFFFSANYRRSDALAEYSKANFRAFTLIKPDETVLIEFDAAAGEVYRLLSMVSHSQMEFTASGEPASDAQEVYADLNQAGFLRKEVVVRPGMVQVKYRNLSKKNNVGTLLRTDYAELSKIMSRHPNVREPFFTAKMLLNDQNFRDLFRIQDLPREFNLNVRSLTLLFTDLKGSTRLYETSGDVAAFNIVQEHFKVLMASVRKHRGAVIKTMGDAIMASFSSPTDAVLAALDMLNATSTFWVDNGVPTMGLKVGIHEGPALAVSADERLDYFGQTVNIAARIQAQAKAGELVLSERLFKDNEVKRLLNGVTGEIELEHAKLRGIELPMPLYHVHLA